MTRPARRSYRFGSAAHWQAGAMEGFAAEGDALAGSQPLTVRKIGGCGGVLLAGTDGCGHLRWLDIPAGQVMTAYPFGVEADPLVLPDAPPLALALSARTLWIGSAGALWRYDAGSLQLIDEMPLPCLAAVAGDGCGGAWAVVGQGDDALLRHFDAWGKAARQSISIEGTVAAGGFAVAPDEAWLAILATVAQESRLVIVDLAGCTVERAEPLADMVQPPAFLSINRAGRLFIVGADGRLLIFERSGALIVDQALPLPDAAKPIAGLFDHDGPVIIGADGLYRIEEAPRGVDAVAASVCVFVTPALVSPPGVPGGWSRLDLDITLPAGNSLRVMPAASDDAPLIAAIADRFAQTAATPAARLAAVDSLIPWRADRARTYAGSGARARLGFLLDGLPETNLWLRIECSVPAGADPPVLHGMTVGYPDLSWMDELPAIYREDAGSAAQLRRFIAPLEALFEGLDAEIGGLPRMIDPATAPAEALPFLLGWLGLPALATLPVDAQRALLARAADLLIRRGTMEALVDLLALVCGERAAVEDSATSALLWVLGSGAAMRLGRDSRVVAARPPAFTPGRVRLGEGAIGRGLCTDIDTVLNGLCATVTIRIAIGGEERRRMEPAIRALLDMFVPAHCRTVLRFVPPGTPLRAPRLDEDFRLADDRGDRLGATSRAGGWRLADDRAGRFPIDGSAALGGRQVLG